MVMHARTYQGMVGSLGLLMLATYISSCSWLVMVWAIPYFMTLRHGSFDRWHGVLLSVLILGVQNVGFIYGCCMLAAELTYYRMLAVLLYIAFVVLVGFLYGICCTYLLRVFMLYRLWVMACMLWLLLIGADYINPLIFPLVPLVHYYNVLWLLPLVGARMLLLVTILLQLCMVYVWFSGSGRLWFLLGAACLVVYCGGLFNDRSGCVRYYPVSSCAVVRSAFSCVGDPVATARHWTRHCYDAASCLRASCIILPESSIYDASFFLHWHAGSDKIAGSRDLLKGLTVVVGGFRAAPTLQHPLGAYNTAWFLGDGYIIDNFDKTKRLLVTEYLPEWVVRCACMGWLYRLYFAQRHYICAGLSLVRPVWQLMPGFYVVPYICSELFYARRPDDVHGDLPIIALCNSSWLAPRLQWIMARCVQFRAYEWNRSIMYIADSYAGMYDMRGNMVALPYENQWCH